MLGFAEHSLVNLSTMTARHAGDDLTGVIAPHSPRASTLVRLCEASRAAIVLEIRERFAQRIVSTTRVKRALAGETSPLRSSVPSW
jgi:hypothetical protein